MPVAKACLVLAGIAQSMSMISAAVILMRTARAHLRGRVMGVHMMVIYGLPLGSIAAGSLIDLIGHSATAFLNLHRLFAHNAGQEYQRAFVVVDLLISSSPSAPALQAGGDGGADHSFLAPLNCDPFQRNAKLLGPGANRRY
jgi:hypothetical protein